MTLDALNCYKFKLSRNFALLRIFVRPIYQDCRELTFALARLSCIYFVCPNVYIDSSGVWNTATVPENFSKTGIFRKPKPSQDSITRESNFFSRGDTQNTPLQWHRHTRCVRTPSGKYIIFCTWFLSYLGLLYTLNLLVLDRKIVVTRCQILRLKCTNSISAGAPPQTPLGDA